MKRNVKNQALKRLRLISGQIHGLERMVSRDEYCIDIITQSFAAKEALSSFEDLILENHLKTHVTEQMRNRKRQKAVREILSIYRLSKRK